MDQTCCKGAQTANALVQMLTSPYIDDLSTTMKLNVQGAYITITPPGTPEAGVPFVLFETMNLAMDSQLAIEIAPSSFLPGGMDQPASSGGVSGVAVAATTSAVFEVDAFPAVVPTPVPPTTTATVPQKTPLCGLLVLAALAAVLLTLRRT